MRLIVLFDRVFKKLIRAYRKQVFRCEIKCPHNDFTLVGDITLINRNIMLGRNVCIYPGCMFFGDGMIEIGDNVDIGKDTVIYASKAGGVTIGDGTMIAAQCYIIDMDHGMQGRDPIRDQDNTVKRVEIGKDVWLAAGVKVLKGTHIHDGSVIGAGAVVKGEIPAYCIAVGLPARVITERT